jgi:hypothetical protein
MPGTQNGTKIKLKGKGFPVYKKEGMFVFNPQSKAKDFKAQLFAEFGLQCEIYHRVGKNEWSTFPVDGSYQLDEAPFKLH